MSKQAKAEPAPCAHGDRPRSPWVDGRWAGWLDDYWAALEVLHVRLLEAETAAALGPGGDGFGTVALGSRHGSPTEARLDRRGVLSDREVLELRTLQRQHLAALASLVERLRKDLRSAPTIKWSDQQERSRSATGPTATNRGDQRG
jgi:hypothetical protein